jgi:hypothetical protein
MESLQRNIDIASLSKTFQDAVEITRRLEVNFLWIDSLCIIQGDKQDWQREASRMERSIATAWLIYLHIRTILIKAVSGYEILRESS